MQFVNNDMDELFRKAAEDYPLHTKGNDWDKVLEKMEKDESSTGRRKQKGHAKWLLLLLPLFFICNRFSYVDHDAAVTSIKTSGERIPKTDDKTVAATASAENKLLKATSTHGPVSKQEVLLSTIEGRGINLSGGSTEDKLPEQKKPTSTRNIAFDDYGSLSKTTKQVKENGSASGAPAVPATGENTRSEIAVSGEPGSKGTSEEKSSLSLPDTLIKQDIGSKRPAKEVKKNINKRGAYAGVLLGPDFSAVQSSKSKGVGYSAGLIVGYNFSNSISLETGIYWDRKRYATTGKNFSTAKFNWPSHTNLLSISGYCDMIEIPLTVRFKHKAGNSGNVFAAAGASSYIMKKEDYQYKTERYGLYYSGKKSYANGSTHLMPVVHFSAGYERTLGGIGNIRIEPYLKLPVAGVGIGDMSLKSAGVYLGITRSIR